MLTRHEKAGKSGITILELLIAMTIFGIMIAVLYPTLSSVSTHINELNDKQELTQKGQRVLDYMGEELRLAGLFVGARPSITYCGEADVNALTHVDGDPYDTISFLTSERVRTTKKGFPFLKTSASAAKDGSKITVNVTGNDVSAIKPASAARSFITFDTLQPNLGTLVYQVTNWVTTASEFTISPNLDQNVNAQSNAYTVVRKQFVVETAGHPRSLRVTKKKSDCDNDNDYLISSHGVGHVNGGVDGFQTEYVMDDGTTASTVAPADIVRVRAIKIWILLRADFPAKDYEDRSSYTLGETKQSTVGPFNDRYRRLLLTRTVEVKNVGF